MTSDDLSMFISKVCYITNPLSLSHLTPLCDVISQTTTNDGLQAVKDRQNHSCGRAWADRETAGLIHERGVKEVCQKQTCHQHCASYYVTVFR